MGIIDTLSAGFDRVVRRPWLMIIPLALDLFLWLGPKVSMSPVIDKTLASMQAAVEALGSDAEEAVEFAEMFEETARMLQETVGNTNLLSLLAWGRLGVPSVAALQDINPAMDRVYEISSYGGLFVAQIAILGIGLVIAVLFLGLIAQTFKAEGTDPRRLIRRAPTYWLHMAAIFVPLGIILIMALTFSIFLGGLAIFVGVAAIWLMVYLSFVPQAVTLSEANPIAALWTSFNIVRLNFWSTLGLLILINVISAGLGFIWGRLMANSGVLTLLAILANAFVGTALAASLFVFYGTRLARWQEMIQQQRSISNNGG